MPARAGGPVVLCLLLGAAVSSSSASAGSAANLVLRDPDGRELVRAVVRAGDPVVLRYRNSLYGSLAEERFVVEGRALRLVELAADERAVLDEYYEIAGGARPAPPGDSRTWRAEPRASPPLHNLAIAATDLGERTLLLDGRPPLELWRFVEDGRPTIALTLEPPG
jgi:hypothetical protein